MWPAIASIAGALLAAIGGVVKATGRGGLPRRVREHLDLVQAAKAVPSAEAALNTLVIAEAEELSRREIARLNRHLNPVNVILSVIVTGVAAVGVYFLIQWAIVAGDWQWFAVLVVVLASLAGLILSGGAVATIYTPTPPRRSR